MENRRKVDSLEASDIPHPQLFGYIDETEQLTSAPFKILIKFSPITFLFIY